MLPLIYNIEQVPLSTLASALETCADVLVWWYVEDCDVSSIFAADEEDDISPAWRSTTGRSLNSQLWKFIDLNFPGS